MPNVVSLINQKGGAGKSTATVNLARALVRAKRTVLVLDADPQASSFQWYVIGDREIGFEVRRATAKAELAKEINGTDAQYVLIDSSGRADEHMLAAIALSHVVLVPVVPSAQDAWATKTTFELIKSHQDANDGRPISAVLYNRVKRTTKVYRAIQDFINERDFMTVDGYLGDRTAYVASFAEGRTVFETTDARAKLEVKHICKQLMRVFKDE